MKKRVVIILSFIGLFIGLIIGIIRSGKYIKIENYNNEEMHYNVKGDKCIYNDDNYIEKVSEYKFKTVVDGKEAVVEIQPQESGDILGIKKDTFVLGSKKIDHYNYLTNKEDSIRCELTDKMYYRTFDANQHPVMIIIGLVIYILAIVNIYYAYSGVIFMHMVWYGEEREFPENWILYYKVVSVVAMAVAFCVMCGFVW